MGVAELQIVDNQARLLRAVHVELSFGSGNDDLHLGPGARVQIHVRLIHPRVLLPQAGPEEIRQGLILGRMVATELVISPSVGRAQINVFSSCAMLLCPHQKTDETPGTLRSTRARCASNLHFDRSIMEIRAGYD